MSEEDDSQKTEQPTGKRLGEARDRGQLPISRETANWVMFLGILTIVMWIGPKAFSDMVGILRIFIEMPHTILLEDRGLQTLLMGITIKIAACVGMIYAILVIGAIAGTMVQTGFFASTEPIKPDISKLSIRAGLSRIFSMSAIVELVKSLAKFIVLGSMGFFTLLPVVYKLPNMNGHSLMEMLAFLHSEATHLIMMLLAVYTVIAIGDLVYQRFSYTKSLKMTKQEVKDEFKQQEGDPLIRQRLRQIRMEKARKRMMAQVPKADVVITNPTHYSIALQYDNAKMAAPYVLAKGTDKVAERIREVAKEHNIPLVSNPPLARALYDTVEIDEEIPTQHYRAVAEVISYVYKLKKRKF